MSAKKAKSSTKKIAKSAKNIKLLAKKSTKNNDKKNTKKITNKKITTKPAKKKSIKTPKKSTTKSLKKTSTKAIKKIISPKIKTTKPTKIKPSKKIEKTKTKIEKKSDKKPIETLPTKPAQKSSKSQDFKIGEYVVYPSHGIGKIIDIEKTTVLGQDFSCYLMHFEKEKLTIKVPLKNSEKIGLRPLASKSQMEEVFSILRSGIKKLKGMWSRRAQEYESKINSGDIILLAEVLRDLTRDIEDSDRSYSERIIYETAVCRLAAEYAAIYKIDFEDAKNKVTITAKDKLGLEEKSEKPMRDDDFDYDEKEESGEEDEELDEDEDEDDEDYDDEDDDESPRKKRRK